MADGAPPDLDTAIAADVAQRQEVALDAWVRMFRDAPTKQLQADLISRLTVRHGEQLAHEVLVRGLLARALEIERPDERQQYLARVEREMGQTIGEKLRDRLAEQWFRQGTTKNAGETDVAAGSAEGAGGLPAGDVAG